MQTDSAKAEATRSNLIANLIITAAKLADPEEARGLEEHYKKTHPDFKRMSAAEMERALTWDDEAKSLSQLTDGKEKEILSVDIANEYQSNVASAKVYDLLKQAKLAEKNAPNSEPVKPEIYIPGVGTISLAVPEKEPVTIDTFRRIMESSGIDLNDKTPLNVKGSEFEHFRIDGQNSAEISQGTLDKLVTLASTLTPEEFQKQMDALKASAKAAPDVIKPFADPNHPGLTINIDAKEEAELRRLMNTISRKPDLEEITNFGKIDKALKEAGIYMVPREKRYNNYRSELEQFNELTPEEYKAMAKIWSQVGDEEFKKMLKDYKEGLKSPKDGSGRLADLMAGELGLDVDKKLSLEDRLQYIMSTPFDESLRKTNLALQELIARDKEANARK